MGREAVREEAAIILRDLPAEVVKVLGARARQMETEARRCRKEADRYHAARRALAAHRAELVALAARTAAAARARGQA